MSKLVSNIWTRGAGLSLSDLRTRAKNDTDGFAHFVEELATSGQLKLEDFRDLKALYQYLGDVRVRVNVRDQSGMMRAMTTSAFPLLTGTTVITAMNAAYEAYPSVGDRLVTEMEDNQKVTVIAALHPSADKDVDEVKELQEFPEVGAFEEYVHIRHRKNGRRLTLSMEMLTENRVGDFVGRVNYLGELAAEHVEELTLYRVTDYWGSGASPAEPYVYRPEGTGTALFSATANIPGTRTPSGTQIQNNALQNETDLQAFRTRIAAARNTRNKPLPYRWSDIVFLIPDALVDTMFQIVANEYVPGIENQRALFGPRGKYPITADQIISTNKLDDLSTSAWYGGWPTKQFKRKWKMRFEYVTLGQDTQAYLDSQVAFQARIAWDCEVGATDYCWWYQNLSATTSPVDE